MIGYVLTFMIGAIGFTSWVILKQKWDEGYQAWREKGYGSTVVVSKSFKPHIVKMVTEPKLTQMMEAETRMVALAKGFDPANGTVTCRWTSVAGGERRCVATWKRRPGAYCTPGRRLANP